MTRSGSARRASDVTGGRRREGEGVPGNGGGAGGGTRWRSHDVMQVRGAAGGRTSRDVV